MYTVKEAPIEGHASAWRVYNDDNFYVAECAIESDARRIARALNMEAAMAEALRKAERTLTGVEMTDYPVSDCLDTIRQALRDMGIDL